jgi:glycosyltransferase involved in cell wall biosynthesis
MIEVIYKSPTKSNVAKVSVVCPMFNVDEYVGKFIESVKISNEYSQYFEFLFIDDRSIDKSCEVVLSRLHKLESLGVDVIVIRSDTNVGSGEIRSTAVTYSTGEWIYFYDTDDVPDDDLFNMMYEASLRQVDIVLGTLVPIGVTFEDSGQPTKILNIQRNVSTIPFASGPGGNMMIRRGLFNLIGGYDPMFSNTKYFGRRVPEDTDLIWRAQIAGGRVELLDEAKSFYTVPFDYRQVFYKQFVYGVQMALHNVRYQKFGKTTDNCLLSLLKVILLALTSPFWWFKSKGRNKYVGSVSRNLGHFVTSIYIALRFINVVPLEPS